MSPNVGVSRTERARSRGVLQTRLAEALVSTDRAHVERVMARGFWSDPSTPAEGAVVTLPMPRP